MEYLTQKSEPLFPDTLWNRPIVARQAGRLLLVGGQLGSFSVPNDIFLAAEAAGIGKCQIAFPDSLQKVLGHTDIAHFVPSNPSGSFGKNSVAGIVEFAEDFDGLGIGGNLGNNSQTTVALESLLGNLDLPIILYDDSLELLRFNADLIARQPKRLVIASMAELFKLAGRLKIALPSIKGDGVLDKLKAVEAVASATQADYLILGSDMIAAASGKLSLTKLHYTAEPSVVYGLGMAFWLQNQSKPFEGLTTAAYILTQFDDRGVYSVPQAASKIRQIISSF